MAKPFYLNGRLWKQLTALVAPVADSDDRTGRRMEVVGQFSATSGDVFDPQAIVVAIQALEDALGGAGGSDLAAIFGEVAANPTPNTVLDRLKTIAAGLTTIAGHVDGLEAMVTALNGYVDGLEALQGTTNTSLATLNGYVDGLEALATTLNTYVDTLEAKGDAQIAALATIGTRSYGTAASRVAVSNASAQSAAVAATEVLLHASTRCFVKAAANPTATNADIPLEAGEKFHMRITSGHKIAVLRDTDDGFLNIVPVA